MNHIIIAALALVAILPFGANAQSNCPANASELPALFEVRTTDTTPVAVDASKSGRELNRISKGFDSRGTLLGVTEASFGSRVVSTQDECGRKLVVLELVLVKQTVFVSSNIETGSCTYRETVDHEMEHVALNRNELARLQAELVQSFDASRYSNDKELAKVVQSELVGRATRTFQDVRALHVKFDQVDAHAARSAECTRDLAAYTARW